MGLGSAMLEASVDHAEMVALIRNGVPDPGGTWADLGAGTGNFTWALRDLLGPDATIYAVDRDARAIAAQRARAAQAPPGAAVSPLQADFIHPLRLPPLDGVLMANALHFVRDQTALLTQIVGYLRRGGRLLVVEYEAHNTLRWVPFPVPFSHLKALTAASGLHAPTLVGTRRSPSTGMVLYAAVATRSTE
jgi:ubiquinone/menaquinone biosynthesis C-methylase UbiE